MKPLRFFLSIISFCLIFFPASAQIVNEEVFPNLPYKTNFSSITSTSRGFFISGVSSLDWSFPLLDYWGTTSWPYCILSPTSLAKKVALLPDIEESRFYGLGGGVNVIDNSFVMTLSDSLFALWSNMRQTYTDVAPKIYYDSLPRLSLAKYTGNSFQKMLTLQNGLHPAITSDKSSALHFVWEEISPIDSIYNSNFSKYSSTLYYQSRNSNGEYSTPIEIGKGFYPLIKTMNDTVHIIFWEADSSSQQIGHLSYIVGRSNNFSDPVQLQAFVLNPYAPYAWCPAPKMPIQWNIDSSGALHVVWHYNYSTVSEQSYIVHYSKENGVYVDSLDDMHAQAIFLKNGSVGIYSVASKNDSLWLQYYISQSGSPLQKIAEHYLPFSLTLNQILEDSAGNEHILLTNSSASYLLKYAATRSAKLEPLSTAYTIFPSSYVDENNHVWLTGTRDSTNVILNFSLGDVGKAEDFDFPLHVGDLWQYYVTNIENPDPLSSFVGYDNVRAEKDTVMPNGKLYALLKSDAGYIFTNWYLRKDGFRVYQYSPNDSTEYLRYDFSKSIGDSVGSGQIVQDIFFDNLFGMLGSAKRTFKMFGGFAPNVAYSSISDSIGIINIGTGLSYNMSLSGAVINGKTYGTIVGVKETPHPIPIAFSLSQNFPNPFNPTTQIRFEIPISGFVTLKVYDILGREVATLVNEKKTPGTYEVEWNAGNVSSGVYFYRLNAGNFVETRKMILMR